MMRNLPGSKRLISWLRCSLKRWLGGVGLQRRHRRWKTRGCGRAQKRWFLSFPNWRIPLSLQTLWRKTSELWSSLSLYSWPRCTSYPDSRRLCGWRKKLSCWGLIEGCHNSGGVTTNALFPKIGKSHLLKVTSGLNHKRTILLTQFSQTFMPFHREWRIFMSRKPRKVLKFLTFSKSSKLLFIGIWFLKANLPQQNRS